MIEEGWHAFNKRKGGGVTSWAKTFTRQAAEAVVEDHRRAYEGMGFRVGPSHEAQDEISETLSLEKKKDTPCCRRNKIRR